MTDEKEWNAKAIAVVMDAIGKADTMFFIADVGGELIFYRRGSSWAAAGLIEFAHANTRLEMLKHASEVMKEKRTPDESEEL